MSFYETSGLDVFHLLVTDKGTTGVCTKGCFPFPTTVIGGRRFCSVHADDKEKKKHKYDEFDGKLKCPASLAGDGCLADQLSPREFWIGTCCEAASRWINTSGSDIVDVSVDDQMVKVLRKYYLETKITSRDAEKESQNCARDFELTLEKSRELKQIAIEAERAAKDAKEKADNAERLAVKHLQKEINQRKRAQTFRVDYEKTRKRMRFLSYELPEAYERNCETESVENSCAICFEDYTSGENNKHQESALPCGHRFCFSCIVDCKNCPTCRKKFTKKQIYKLF